MLLTFYVVLAWLIVPFAMEFINTKTTTNNTLVNIVNGVPAYMINLIVCAVVALIITFLPGGWKTTIGNWFLLTTVTYFGNAFFFQTVVKPLKERISGKHTG